MQKFSLETISAAAAVIAAVFAGYSGWEAHQTRLTTHQDAVDQVRQTQRAYIGVQVGRDKKFELVGRI